jgi:hypothetical protein
MDGDSDLRGKVIEQLKGAKVQFDRAVKTFTHMQADAKNITGAKTRVMADALVSRAGDALKNMNASLAGQRAQLYLMGQGANVQSLQLTRRDNDAQHLMMDGQGANVQSQLTRRDDDVSNEAKMNSLAQFVAVQAFIEIYEREMAGLKNSQCSMSLGLLLNIIETDPELENDPELMSIVHCLETDHKNLASEADQEHFCDRIEECFDNISAKVENSMSNSPNLHNGASSIQVQDAKAVSSRSQVKVQDVKAVSSRSQVKVQDVKAVSSLIKNSRSFNDDLNGSGKSSRGWVLFAAWTLFTAANTAVAFTTGTGICAAILGTAIVGTPVGITTFAASAVVAGLLGLVHTMF